MKKISILLIVAFCFGLSACSKDADVNAFISEFDATTKEITSKIDADPSETGVDAAQKAFDARKANLKTKWDSIKDAVGIQVSADTKKKLEDSVTANMKTLTDVATKHAMELAQDGNASNKFQKLVTEFTGMFTMDSK
jgi:hypothetical protein